MQMCLPMFVFWEQLTQHVPCNMQQPLFLVSKTNYPTYTNHDIMQRVT